MASDCITQNKQLAHMNKIMKHATIYITGMLFCTSLHCQLQNSYIACVNKWIEQIEFEKIDFKCF